LLAHSEDAQASLRIAEMFAPIGSITVLERPLGSVTLISTLQVAMRTRRRQYQVRDLLLQQKQTAEALRASQENSKSSRMRCPC
jgi:hypothetical protein